MEEALRCASRSDTDPLSPIGHSKGGCEDPQGPLQSTFPLGLKLQIFGNKKKQQSRPRLTPSSATDLHFHLCSALRPCLSFSCKVGFPLGVKQSCTGTVRASSHGRTLQATTLSGILTELRHLAGCHSRRYQSPAFTGRQPQAPEFRHQMSIHFSDL